MDSERNSDIPLSKLHLKDEQNGTHEASSGNLRPTASSPAPSVTERERIELEALYPSSLVTPESDGESQPSTPSRERAAEARYFLHIQNERVEGFLAPFPTVIDFSLPNTRILSAEFVCLRKLPLSSLHTQKRPQPRRSVRNFLSGMMTRRPSNPVASSVNVRGESEQQGWKEEEEDGEGREEGAEGSHLESQETVVVQKRWTRQREPPTDSTNGEDAAKDKDPNSRVRIWQGGVTGDASLAFFELLWKESRLGGTEIRRLRFETNEAGYEMISSKLDRWAVASHSTSQVTDPVLLALMKAAEAQQAAAAAANQESPKGQVDPSPSPSPSASTGFSRSFFGRRKSFGDKNGSSETPKGSSSSRGSSPKYGGGGPMGTQPDGRARLDAAREALELVGGCTREVGPQGSLPENVIMWGSVMVEGKYLPRRDGVSAVLRDSHFKALAASLPARLRSSSWSLLYSTSRDGISLATLYRKVAKKGPTLVVARDAKHHVFGCFGSEEWKVATKYYGNGECFVFQVQPELKAFRWTRANSYFMYSTASVLAMGGGTHYSLLMNSDLLTGYSGECETFGSQPLAGSEEFELRHVEVWGFK